MSNSGTFHFQGLAGLGLSLVAGRASQALAFVCMARFLSAEQMGQVAVFTALFLGLYQLTNLGFDRYIVYAKVSEGEELARTIDGVWSLQLARGVMIMLLSVPVYFLLLLFPQLSLGLDEVIAIAVIILIFSIATPELSSFERRGDFSFVSRARGAGMVAGAALTIALVSVWRSPWAYLVGQMINAAVFAALSFFYSSRVPRIMFERVQIGQIWNYAQHLIIIAIVSFVSTQSQHFYVGAMFGSATLGMYFTWHRLVNLPGEFVTQLQDKLLFAKASHDARLERDSGMLHLMGLALSMACLLPFYLFVWFHGDTLMSVIATDRWTPFWWVGKVFVLIALLFNIAGTMSPLMLVKVPQITSKLRIFEAAFGFALILILGSQFAIPGVLAALLIEIAIAVPVRIFLLYRFVVKRKRLAHAQTAILIFALIAAPLIAWEFLAASILATTYLPFISAAIYAIWIAGLACVAFLARAHIQSRLTT